MEDTNSPTLPATPMLSYIARRILYMALLLLALSFFSFVLIELPPGTFLDNLIQQLRNQGVQVDLEEIRTLEERYGLNRPFLSRYGMWMRNLARGDMGDSLAYNQPVTQLIGQRLLLTVAITMLTLVLTYAIVRLQYRSASIPRRTSIRLPTTPSPCLDSSAWRRPISSSR